MTGRILVADGDLQVVLPLVRTLELEGHRVRGVRSGRAVLDTVVVKPVEVVILGRELPDMDSLDVCRALREEGYTDAVLVLGDRDSELDTVFALDSGADDFLSEPFGLAELQARVRALLRRAGHRERPGTSPDSDLRIQRDARQVFAGDTELRLSGKEFDVLSVLEANRGRVVTRARLVSEVWDTHWYGSTKTVDVTIGRVRQKLREAGLADGIIAVRGIGFRLEVEPGL